MEWWLWILLGIGLLAAEILTPGGFFVLFFGVAALLVGALVVLGVGGPSALQWLLFSVLSVVSLLLFRRRLVERFATPTTGRLDEIDSLRGEVAIASEDLAPGGLGKAELRGTIWTVKNTADQPLRAGQRGRVVGKDGLTLFVHPE
jgi:membrane protein implicated in regulation of membrane protease activity